MVFIISSCVILMAKFAKVASNLTKNSEVKKYILTIVWSLLSYIRTVCPVGGARFGEMFASPEQYSPVTYSLLFEGFIHNYVPIILTTTLFFLSQCSFQKKHRIGFDYTTIDLKINNK